jgi:hypothetical protein
MTVVSSSFAICRSSAQVLEAHGQSIAWREKQENPVYFYQVVQKKNACMLDGTRAEPGLLYI